MRGRGPPKGSRANGCCSRPKTRRPRHAALCRNLKVATGLEKFSNVNRFFKICADGFGGNWKTNSRFYRHKSRVLMFYR
jgi:hypothetical protein